MEDIKEDSWQRLGSEFESGVNPALTYVWACLWMRREIEANACRWEHVQTDAQGRRVSLYTPVSKMDQGARGVKRILQCCGQDPCMWFCAWKVWERIEAENPRKKARKGFISVDKLKIQLSKAKTIENWRSATGPSVTGHSARRSGAMEHVRQGLQIQELAFLGRWKSAVVLTYANDALQDMPANRGTQGRAEPWDVEIKKSPWTPIPAPGTPMIQAPRTPALQARPQQVEVPQHFKEELEKSPQQKLSVAAVDKKKGKKTWHQVTKAGWQISLASWSTACGWNFTKNPDKVTMSVALVFNQTRCIKCTEVMKARDKVKEGPGSFHAERCCKMVRSKWWNSC